MKTVLLFGTFDLFHAGHLSLLKQAHKLGDRIVVVIARDVNVKKTKGQLPLHDEKERLELLKHIDLIDEAVLGDAKDVYKVIEKIKPDVIALGYDQVAFTDKLQAKLTEFKLVTKIVRLKPFQEKTKKSSKLKAHLLLSIWNASSLLPRLIREKSKKSWLFWSMPHLRF